MQLASVLRHHRVAIAVTAGAVVGVLVLAIAGLFLVQRGAILPNTVVAGVEVGGMDEGEARSALAPEATAREREPVVFRFQGDEHVLIPHEVGFEVDLEATVDRAMGRGRDGRVGDLVERVRALRSTRSFELVQRSDDDQLGAWVAELADDLDQDEVRGEVDIDPDSAEVELVASKGLIEVDREATFELAHDALVGDGPREHELPARTSQQALDNDLLAEAADQAATALEEPLVLRAGDEELALSPERLAALLAVEERPGTAPRPVALVVDEDAIEEHLAEDAADRFDTTPRDASFQASRTPPATFDVQGNATYRPVGADVTVVEGTPGRSFDASIAAEQLTEVVRAGGRTVELRLEEVEPELSAQEAQEIRPTHAIGTFTTYYQAGQVRNQNIQLLADVIDGTLVLPGETFSINEVSGERSCSKGYQPAGTIVQGELVDTCGGGTSQFGTTTFNAAFFAGVQLDQWRAHSWYISRYPMGREATLSYPVLDVRFTNNTDGAILVKTAHTSTSVTVTLYGVPRAEAVSARHGSRTNPRGFDTEVRRTSELYEGQERVLQSGAGGFTVSVRRIVELVGGGTEERTITTTYVPQTRIVERGTRPAPSDDDGSDED